MATTPIPTVDPNDLERLYGVYRELTAEHPGRAIGEGLFSQHFTPGVDSEAICRRLTLLVIVANFPEEILQGLSPCLNSDGSWSPSALRVAARFPMNWVERGTFLA